ncbi:hypothetical protein [Picrophilus oshimae]|uniref:Uncharacterized protein n=1 Tax=Picrophilus torridus (strain ATCC 700027 / DSM 9790 / JCM 10055 / NBRC 100828 / KAW 2/3) TaxID=1122961 RepID=Q6KZZ2_PICTO|nr:hypothetical protein [Picrophilus oshimae]AAT43710.1 hypothetical protein PTO1125 [Picrophilus oshimae DSM 9789]
MNIITFNYDIPRLPLIIVGQKRSIYYDVEVSLGTNYFGNNIYGVIPLNLKNELELRVHSFENFERHGMVEKRSVVKPTLIIRTIHPIKIENVKMVTYNGDDIILSRSFLVDLMNVKRIVMDFKLNKISYICH